MKESSRETRPRRWIVFVFLAVLLVGFGLARTPDLPSEVLEAKYGAPPSKYLTLPSGARVHYRDQGNPDGKVLVLLHGSNASLHTWEPWVSALKDRFRVITLDLPGHGLTGPVPSDDYSLDGMVMLFDVFRSQLGLHHFALGGNSMGGNVSWRFALARPNVVTDLILIDSGGVDHLLSPEHRPVLPIGFRLTRLPVVNLLAEYVTPRRVVEKSLLGTLNDPQLVTPEMVDRYYELLLYPGNRRATRLRNGAENDVTEADRLSEIHVPTLILWGEKDKLRDTSAARIFQSRIAGSTLVTYPNVGHLPMEEIPARSASDAARFLLSHS